MSDKETKEEPKTRQMRFFMYQDGEKVVIGKQKVRYEPDVKKNIFGTICVEVIFPVKRETKHGFALDLYPDVNEDHPEKNILGNVDDGCKLLFIEANRSAGLQARSVCKISREEFDYSKMTILTEKDVVPKEVGFSPASPVFYLKGVITKDHLHLRKGDVIDIGDCYEEEPKPGSNEKKKIFWHCHWSSEKRKWKWYEPFRRLWLKLFNKEIYAFRYRTSSEILNLEPTLVRITSGSPVEEQTKRKED